MLSQPATTEGLGSDDVDSVSDELHRLLAVLHGVPTDADYAMELIAQRVAGGQEIKPLNRKQKIVKVDVGGSPDVLSRDLNEDGKSRGTFKQGVSALKTVADAGYQAIGGQRVSMSSWNCARGA